jgi:hypothetical protein
VFAINPASVRDERGGAQAPTTTILEDAVAATADVAAATAASLVEDGEDGEEVMLRISAKRFNAMSRLQAAEAGQWNSAFLLNRLRDLSPEGVEALAHYFAETSSDLRERAFRLKAERLHAETSAWREAGCPGLAPLAPRPERPVSSERKAESALARLKLMISKAGETPSGEAPDA